MKNTRILSILLLCGILVSSLISCNGDNTTGAEQTDIQEQQSQTTTVEDVKTEYAREETPDTLPELDFDGAAVRIVYRGDSVTQLNETEGENAGDVVSDAIYNRNISVSERLNVKFEWIKENDVYRTFMDKVRAVISAGEDAYDIIDGIQWFAAPQAVEGFYTDLIDAPYLDWSQPWWDNRYMDEISLNPDVRYMLIGDISIWKLRHTSATFFNKDMYSANFGDPNELYQTVLDGKWTHEKFREVVKTVYSDVNNNGVADAGDIIGAATTPAAMNDHFSYTAGIRFTERDSDGYPKLITNHERNNRIVETLHALYFETPGMYICDRTMSGTVQDGDYKNWFVSGNMLLYPHRLYATENFRDMEDEYGIIPFPKLDETQEEYLSLVSDATTVFSVPITKADIELPCAVLEAMCAENYRTVVPAYYDIALKVKYARDNIAGQMIDIIHDGTTTDFMYANNYAFDANNMGLITRELFYKNSKDYISMYDSISNAVEVSMNEMIANIKK